jgi:hypothetical protein
MLVKILLCIAIAALLWEANIYWLLLAMVIGGAELYLVFEDHR